MLSKTLSRGISTMSWALRSRFCRRISRTERRNSGSCMRPPASMASLWRRLTMRSSGPDQSW
jgi:hypothetical protein